MCCQLARVRHPQLPHMCCTCPANRLITAHHLCLPCESSASSAHCQHPLCVHYCTFLTRAKRRLVHYYLSWSGAHLLLCVCLALPCAHAVYPAPTCLVQALPCVHAVCTTPTYLAQALPCAGVTAHSLTRTRHHLLFLHAQHPSVSCINCPASAILCTLSTHHLVIAHNRPYQCNLLSSHPNRLAGPSCLMHKVCTTWLHVHLAMHYPPVTVFQHLIIPWCRNMPTTLTHWHASLPCQCIPTL